jgi:ribose transport system ATP-binding protein
MALQDVSFSVDSGETLAIIGENGAGKSTLMKILGGAHRPDQGEVVLDGLPVHFADPADSLHQGVRVVYQELSLLDNLTIAANVFLGQEPRSRLGLMDSKKIEAETAKILQRVGLRHSPSTLVSRLSLAERQLVEIARALSTRVKWLVLDEPTSSLTLEETERLLDLIRDLKHQGVTVLFISHRLNEVKAIADRVVVLKDGRLAGELKQGAIEHEAMIRLMVGRDLARSAFGTSKEPGQARLSLRGVRTKRYANVAVDLDVFRGEILGMAGLVGAGRSELARVVFGIDRRVGGELILDGVPVSISSSHDAVERGVYLAPEDRRGAGLVVESSVRENISLPSLAGISTFGMVDRRRERAMAQNRSDRFRVKTPAIETPVMNLSGGNQQKVVLARWVPREPKVMVFDEPTRGIDVGSKAEIYAEMRALADSGVAVWMISSDMEEVLTVSDRIAVMEEGRLTGVLTRAEATEERVMKLALAGAA